MFQRWEGEKLGLMDLQLLDQLRDALFVQAVRKGPRQLVLQNCGVAARGFQVLLSPSPFACSRSLLPVSLVVHPVLHAQCFAGQRTALRFPPGRNCLQASFLWLLADWEGFPPCLCSHNSPLSNLGQYIAHLWCSQPLAISSYHSLSCHCLVKLYILAFLKEFPISVPL